MAAKKASAAKMKLAVHIWGYNGHQCIDRADMLGDQLAAGSFEYSRWAEVAWNRDVKPQGNAGAKCLEITAEGNSADECIDLYNAQVDMLASGCMDVLPGCTVDFNHGDGGGP